MKSTHEKIDFWHKPATIQPNNFIYKSLSSWSYNVAIGCEHACRFCYVPDVSTNRMAKKLEEYGVTDPDAQWGDYLLLRRWDSQAFLASLRAAEKTPIDKLNPDGNRAVMLCTTTDPYQVIRHPDAGRRAELQDGLKTLVREALICIHSLSTLNVRILTRSPLARRDFELMSLFKNRLLFGMSLPTLNNKLAKIYEPKAPAPSQRLETLKLAKEYGLNVFVAVAPTYPECNEDDLKATFAAIAELNPVTVFHEPVNIRAENVKRIEEHANSLGFTLSRKSVFETRESWVSYAWEQLKLAEQIAKDSGLIHCFHSWPDNSLGSNVSLGGDKAKELWLQKYWNRISEWPGK